ncbi:MAG: hypothetical protein ACT4OI_09175, partial [Methanobacteriota archaeon]
MGDIRRLVLRRGRNAVVTVFGIMVLNFFLINFMGDPVELLAPKDPKIPDEYVQVNCKRFGLCGDDGEPLTVPERFWLYLQNTFTGNWGISYFWKGADVLDVVVPAFAWTILLIGTSTVITILLGMALGALSALRRGRAFDIITTGFSLFFYGMPFFWLALVMQLTFRQSQFGLNWWPVLPTSQEYDVSIAG